MGGVKFMSIGQKLIVFVSSFVITIVTICTIFKSDISFLLTSRSVERNYGKTPENSYFIEDNFNYVNFYDKAEVHSKEEIINSIYYLINSGVSYSKRYCARDYDNCYQDMQDISSNTELLSLLNNYIHPYNSFDSILFNFDDKIIEIEIRHTYTKEEIAAVDKKVDEIMHDNLNAYMSTKEKIKVIHDYIINNTEYDTLKTKNIKDTTYRSNTAYGVLIQKYGICSGYSDAMKIFLDKLNIINYKISNNDHIWNLVYLDDVWYHLDLTWDDPVSEKNITRDNYFMINTKTLKMLNDDVHSYNSNIFSEAK